ncbi:MAG: chemotaxis protein CheW [Cyanobacteria bacterium P01_A01_bin.37]
MSNNFSIADVRSIDSSVRSLTLPDEKATQEPSPSDDQQFLRLKLFSNITALLPMQQLGEVLTIPVGQVVPIPNMPAWVMGIYNWRGDILWIADLSHFLGLMSWNHQANTGVNYTVVVLNVHAMSASSSSSDNQMIGLVVNETEDTEQCNPDEIQSSIASSVNPALARFLQGYWLNPNGEMLAVLDGNAMLDGMSNP